MEALKSNAWPGNIRQLRHAVEKAVIITDNTVIGSADLATAGGCHDFSRTGDYD